MTAVPAPGSFRDRLPGGRWCVIPTEGATVVYWQFEPGVEIPRHAHPHAQISIVVTGGIDMRFDDETVSLGPGQVCTIAPERPHGGILTARSTIVDVFVPNRVEYEDDYRERRQV